MSLSNVTQAAYPAAPVTARKHRRGSLAVLREIWGKIPKDDVIDLAAPGGAIVVPGLAPIPVGNNFQTSEQRFFGPRGSFAYSLGNLRGHGDTFTASILGSRTHRMQLCR